MLRPLLLAVPLALSACSPSAPDPAPPRLPVPIRDSATLTLIRGQALEQLVRGSVQTRPGTGGRPGPTERFAATGDAYTLAYDRPDTSGRYRITPDRVCLRFVDERSIFCRFYLRDTKGGIVMAEDDRDYPLHTAPVTITRAP